VTSFELELCSTGTLTHVFQQSLTLEDGYNNDEGCPHDLDTGPQPSKRAVLNGNAGLHKRDDRGELSSIRVNAYISQVLRYIVYPFQFPHDSNRIDTYVRGGDDSTSFSHGSVADNYYVCYIKPPTTAQGDSVFC